MRKHLFFRDNHQMPPSPSPLPLGERDRVRGIYTNRGDSGMCFFVDKPMFIGIVDKRSG